MKTLSLVRVMILLGAMLGGTTLWAQSMVSLRFVDAGMPVTNAQVAVEQGGVALGSGVTDGNGQVTIPVSYLRGPSIDVNGTQRVGNSSRSWNLKGVVTLDTRNSAEVHLDQATSPALSTMFPGNIASTWPTTTMPSTRMLQPTSPANLGAFTMPTMPTMPTLPTTTSTNPSLGGIDLNQILAANNATLSATDIAGLQSAMNAMNSASLGNSLNGYSIYVPNTNGSNTILKIPGGSPTTTFNMPATNTRTTPTSGPIIFTRPDEDSTATPKSAVKTDTTQPKVVNPTTKPRVKLHVKSETGEPISVFIDDNQVNPTPNTDVVAQLPIVYGLNPVLRVEFQKKSIPAIEQTLTLSGTQAQYNFVVRKNARGEWVVE